jgi:N-acetylneuraminate synthase
MNEVFIIAEIGINHNGNIDTAKKLIDLAKSCGCDAVKFQKRDIDTVYSKKELDSFRESLWGKTFRDQKNGLEFQEKQYDEINVYCKTKKIEWFASAWDVKSLEFLEKYKLNYNKIASAMITNKFFLEHVAKKKIKTFISTGMSNYNIIDEAIDIFKKNGCEFELMHSVSAYPCPEESLNLNIITKLKKKYNCRIGYSGHEPSVTPSIVAAALGINSLERHITLSRAMYGSDQSASLEESGLRYLVNAVRKVSKVLGSEDKKIFDIELPIAKKLRYWEKK